MKQPFEPNDGGKKLNRAYMKAEVLRKIKEGLKGSRKVV